MTEFEVGQMVKIEGEKGTVYRVLGYSKDGSVKLYGGSPNPNKTQRSRSVMPNKVRPVSGK